MKTITEKTENRKKVPHLRELLAIHNKKQAHGNGIKINIQITGKIVYLITSLYDKDGGRKRPSLGLSIPDSAGVIDQQEIYRQAIGLLDKYYRNPQALISEYKPTPSKLKTEKNLGDWLEEWQKTCFSMKKRSNGNASAARKRILDFWGADKDVTQIHRSEGKDYCRYVDTLKHSLHYLSTIKGWSRIFFTWLLDKEIIVSMPSIKRSTPKQDANGKFIEPAEIKKLIDTKSECPEPALADLFLYGVCVGARKCDLKNMVFADVIERKEGKFVVKSANAYTQLKTKYPATMYMGSSAQKIIMERWQSSQKLNDLVFPCNIDKQSDSWAEWCALAGLERKIKLSWMRHTCATNMINAGCDLKTVKEFIGWSSYIYVDTVYAGYDKSQLHNVARMIELPA